MQPKRIPALAFLVATLAISAACSSDAPCPNRYVSSAHAYSSAHGDGS